MGIRYKVGLTAEVGPGNVPLAFLAETPGRAAVPLGWLVLGQSAVATSAPADTTEDTLATIPVPGGCMGPNGRVRVTAHWTYTNSANTKTMVIRFGGTAVLSSAQSTSASYNTQQYIANRNSLSSQVAANNATSMYSIASTALITASIDTSADTTITITGQKASAGETLTLESYYVESSYGA